MTMAAQHKAPRYRTDWFRVIVDLQYAGWDLGAVSQSIEVAPSTIRGWKAGSEPPYEAGRLLLQLWSVVMGKGLLERPVRWD